MKLDLILENIRNSYTLNLLEESSATNVSEVEVLKGKKLINESTMMLRKILIQEGVMEDVKAVISSRFRSILEESIFGDWQPATEEEIQASSDAAAARIAANHQAIADSVKNAGNAVVNGFKYVNGTQGDINGDIRNAFNSNIAQPIADKVAEIKNNAPQYSQSEMNAVNNQLAQSQAEKDAVNNQLVQSQADHAALTAKMPYYAGGAAVAGLAGGALAASMRRPAAVAVRR